MAATKDQVAQLIVAEAKSRAYTRDECLAVKSTLYQESGWSETIWDPTHTTYGIAQQDGSYPNRFGGAAAQIKGFFDKLDTWRRKPGASTDIWLNICWMQQRPNWESAAYWYANGRRAYLTEIKSRIATVTPYLDKYWPTTATPPPTTPSAGGAVNLADPITRALWTSGNHYAPRNMPSPMWIACHTSESRSRAVNLRNYCEGAGVSYNRIIDDVDIVGMVRDANAPWAAVGANKYAYHICWSWSFASWSREQWLDTNPSDGFDERNALRLGAKQIAYWVQESREAGREIPVEWIGGRNRPPWGLNGICGHVDFGAWGGGHTDPGVNFPVNTLLSDVRAFLTGEEQPPIVVPPPVVVPGTNPDKYADWMLYQGNPSNNVDRVRAAQRRLKAAYAAYAGHLAIDGDFGPLTRLAVQEFQRRSGLIADGIVGPMTAAALKP
jgi:Putative peptidoglycan binding domain